MEIITGRRWPEPEEESKENNGKTWQGNVEKVAGTRDFTIRRMLRKKTSKTQNEKEGD